MKLNFTKRAKQGIFIFFLFISSAGWSQTTDTTSTESIDELLQLNAFTEQSELQKIINSKVSVSSKKELSVRETPGIISLVTAEEIANSGARDLVDVLRMVPGMDFGTDVEFGLGLGIRGNWANEGKVLLLVDGIMSNEILYQTIQFGNHFPVDLIAKIEIIRGPGSAIYGGAAEYGVINIITKGGNGLEGILAAGTYGQMQKTYGRRNLGLAFGKTIKDFHVDVAAFKGQGNRTDQDYVNLGSNSVSNLKDSSQANPFNINVGLKYKNGSLRVIYDDYSNTTNFYKVTYNSILADLKYKFSIGKKFNITPQVTYTNQTPWHYAKSFHPELPYEYKVIGTRIKGNLTGSYDLTNKINFIAGTEYFIDHAIDKLGMGNFTGSLNTVQYSNVALFGQGLLKHRLFNFTAGFRYDNHSAFGSAFVPRFAITKKVQNFHFKVLYSKSFRSPSIENMANPDIKPEKSTIMEVEAGYQFTAEMLLTANIFKVSTKNTIIYTYQAATSESIYLNAETTGSSGIELEYKMRYGWGYINLGYSFYRANLKDTTSEYYVSANRNNLLGFPNHKFTINSSFKIWKGLRFNPSFVAASARYGYTLTNLDTEEQELHKIPAYLLANVFVNYENLFAKGLTAGIGVYDLLNQRPSFVQPYNGDYAPLPGASREFVFKLSYNLSFSK